MSEQTSRYAKMAASLSYARIERYETFCEGDKHRALKLYRWNLEISGECFKVLHVCEVVFRNAVAEALELKYGPNWPSVKAFQVSLPNPSNRWSPRKELERLAQRHPGKDTVGKLISECTFAFWCRLLTKHQHDRIWKPLFREVFPNAPFLLTTNDEREFIFATVSKVRELRNRIAHHEPIFFRPLHDEIEAAMLLIGARCPETEAWCREGERVFELLRQRP